MFANDEKVSFADVNLSEERISGPPYNPGQGGWPTVRYFNKETGYDGAPYIQKTSMKMCDELKDIENMKAFVEEFGNTKAV